MRLVRWLRGDTNALDDAKRRVESDLEAVPEQPLRPEALGQPQVRHEGQEMILAFDAPGVDEETIKIEESGDRVLVTANCHPDTDASDGQSMSSHSFSSLICPPTSMQVQCAPRTRIRRWRSASPPDQEPRRL